MLYRKNTEILLKKITCVYNNKPKVQIKIGKSCVLAKSNRIVISLSDDKKKHKTPVSIDLSNCEMSSPDKKIESPTAMLEADILLKDPIFNFLNDSFNIRPSLEELLQFQKNSLNSRDQVKIKQTLKNTLPKITCNVLLTLQNTNKMLGNKINKDIQDFFIIKNIKFMELTKQGKLGF